MYSTNVQFSPRWTVDSGQWRVYSSRFLITAILIISSFSCTVPRSSFNNALCAGIHETEGAKDVRWKNRSLGRDYRLSPFPLDYRSLSTR